MSRDLSRRKLLKATLATTAVSVVGAGAGLALPGAAQAAPSGKFPWIIDCDSWGARPPADPLTPSTIATNKIIVHHMAFPNVTDYSREQAVKLANDCQALHMDKNGWSDTGQHFTISRGGYVLEGRHGSLDALDTGSKQIVSAHCPGENTRAIGIENEGTYVSETPPEALFESLTKLCAAIGKQYGLHAYDIFGHWDARSTLCPGAAFYREFPRLRRAVAKAMRTKPRDVPKRRWIDTWRFVNGPNVRVAQYLLLAQGYELTPDSGFGPITVAAVQDWQARVGLPVDPDATMTPETWESLTPVLLPGATGIPVQGLQFMLNSKGYAGVTITGTYDEVTLAAVRDLQKLHNLEPSGKVGETTWCVLTGGVVRQAFEC